MSIRMLALSWLLLSPCLYAQDVELNDLRAFAEVFGLLQREYVEPLSDRELLESAIAGMLSELDPHTEYLSADELRELSEETEGAFGGVGIETDLVGDELVIIAPLPDSPAAAAKLQPGDTILAVDGNMVADTGALAAAAAIRGEPGTEVQLRIRRGADGNLRELVLIREVVHVQSVESALLEGGIAKLIIRSFQSETADTVQEELVELKRRNGAPLRGVVIDLRSNPGGLVSSAVATASLFLDGGPIVRIQGRDDHNLASYDALVGDLAAQVPIVVWIDAGTASAAEIVAAGLRDRGRAVLMGSASFGKGSVQTIVPLANGGGLKLTTARYLTASGRPVIASGLVPDVPIKDAQTEAAWVEAARSYFATSSSGIQRASASLER